MRLVIGQREFAPRPWAALATVPVLALFVSLGFWQIDRAEEKRNLVTEFAAGREILTVGPGVDIADLPRYQRIRLAGRYDPGRQVLLDNMPSAGGAPGYRVLTPLIRADGGGIVLVDRGWVPLGPSRDELPDVAVHGGERLVSGRLDRLPVPGLRLGSAAASEEEKEWPRVLNFPLRAEVEGELGVPVAERIMLLDAELPDGYERKWQPSAGFGPARHLGYAIQWFALALTLVVLFVVLSLRPVSDKEAQDS